MLDLERQYTSIRPQVLTAIERVCSSQHFILGAEGEALEQEIARFTGAVEAVGCASGSDALWLALLAAGIRPGDAVITSPFSFVASASAIARAGARPIFVDIDAETLNLDPHKVRQTLGERRNARIRAILPVHLFGQCADMDALGTIAREFKVVLIEDAAQAIGALWQGEKAGSLGAAAAFSFYPTKNLSAYGDAGMVTTREPQWARHMRQLRNHGSPLRYYHQEMGGNSRLDEIQAAVLRVKLGHVENWNRERGERARSYNRLLEQAGLAGAPSSPIIILSQRPEAESVFHQYVVRARDRDRLRHSLSERQISTEIYYPIPLHLQPCFGYLGYLPGDLPESERAAREALALPMFPELREEELRSVVEGIADFYHRPSTLQHG
jgi:dTDP-4-amino-4,6-dideoxygalactose transaminase